jgi:hypothetical protein
LVFLTNFPNSASSNLMLFLYLPRPEIVTAEAVPSHLNYQQNQAVVQTVHILCVD